ncbi:Crp/Fnr family transcriptional regulator [Chryseobacterium taihuense]|uniref:cAMP-binding domain of CRP or a regulatory subunit of cAMP-dependent protein kinases n=1 Tax=Chryseobacterium taihuense TaxID=1141221 RepID=A0ABY0QT75_9FLAO|nr:Crp/Fnr family transcriptional regulator [Chryseobacterium taihuense]SDL80333.1 cAMP-binding domain of CRP or a regulatory subunit of cAMP-dependent protein kinases [Chryseobacterium taihuense]
MNAETDQLYQFFITEFPFNKEGLELFVNSFETKNYKKNQPILQFGETEKELRFLDSGIIREFYANNGKEKNIGFFLANEFVTDFYSFVSEKPTRKNQECVTDVQIRTLTKEKFLHFLKEYSCGKLFVDEIFQRIIEKKEQDEFGQFINTAEENYKILLQHQPIWLQQIPQYHIASYLGITPETLSRIRKRIF